MSTKDNPIRRNHKGLPVSRTLPLRAGGEVVREGDTQIKVHRDGMRTDMNGRPIVANGEDRRRVEAYYQCERED